MRRHQLPIYVEDNVCQLFLSEEEFLGGFAGLIIKPSACQYVRITTNNSNSRLGYCTNAGIEESIAGLYVTTYIYQLFTPEPLLERKNQ